MKNPAAYSSGHVPFAIATVPFNVKIREAFSLKPRTILVILLSVSLLLQSQFINAQAPQQFSFQGVARDATGAIVKNTAISVRIQIHRNGPNGEIVFSEIQVVETNSFGIFDLVIGGLSGNLDEVNWGNENHFIQIEVDIAGGTSFVNLGTTFIKSVPYSLYSRESGKWKDNSPIIQKGDILQSPTLPPVGSGPTMLWYPKKSAFRVGYADSQDWEEGKIGAYSFCAGYAPDATGLYAISLGNQSKALAESSIALGSNSIAEALNAVAIGSGTHAEGQGSIALGLYSSAKAYAAVTAGTFNNITDNPNAVSPDPSDRIFQLGNGSGNLSRSNALTILRNGNVGIGNKALDPQYILDIVGRPRIRHSGGAITSGLHLDDSQGNADNFIGMLSDNQIGFYLNGGWRFWVDDVHAYVNGFTVNTSDRRLKKDLTPLEKSLSKVNSLHGYFYKWLDPKRDQSIQTGLMAQDVEKQFPELVTTEKDGYKAVNYTGLIPHLIEAVKELDKKTEEIAALKKELTTVQEMNKKLSALEASVRELLAGQKGTSTQTAK